jgi:hypothetical protein
LHDSERRRQRFALGGCGLASERIDASAGDDRAFDHRAKA